jgi:two-component system cell cycle sensor histidine kinase/response regulator CckA
MIQYLPEYLLILDENLRVVDLSDQFCTLAQRSRLELIGSLFSELCVDEKVLYDKLATSVMESFSIPIRLKEIPSEFILRVAVHNTGGRERYFISLNAISHDPLKRDPYFVLENTNDAVLVMNPNGRIEDLNRGAAIILGRDREELINHSALDFLHQSVHDRFAPFIEMVHSELNLRNFDILLVNNRTIKVNASLMPDGNIYLSGSDITQERHYAGLLEQSEKRYHSLFELAPDAIMVETTEGVILEANELFCRIFKYHRDEIVGMHITRLLPPGSESVFYDGMQNVLRNGFNEKDVINIDREGNKIHLSLRETVITLPDGSKGVMVMLRDISEKKKTELALRSSEAKYRLLVENLHEGFFILKDEKIFFSNSTFCSIIGRTQEDVVGKSLHKFVRPTYRTKLDMLMRKLRTDKVLPFDDLEFAQPDGSIRTVQLRLAQAILDDETTYVGIIQDTTEFKSLSRELDLQKNIFQNIIEGAPVAIHVIDAWQGTSFLHNQAFTKMFRVDPDLYFADYNLWQDPLFDPVFSGKLKQIRDQHSNILLPEINLYDSGQKESQLPVMSIQTLAFTINDDKGRPVYLVLMMQDISQQKALEQQLMQAQKMESVGNLASGIAHDFNNLLGGILGYASLLKNFLAEGERTFKYVESIEKAARRAAELTNHMLAFSRKGKSNEVAVNLNDAIRNVIELMNRSIYHHIEVDLDLSPNLPAIIGDPVQMEQVLMNLWGNAIDAMPEGGKISFHTSEFIADELSSREYPTLESGHYSTIEITDTGVGIPADVIPNIFEPFFTTKEVGKGTGLGLALVYGIVKNHGGHVFVESQIGHGTHFKIFLPASAEAAHQTEEHNAMSENQPHSAGKILIIDDEEMIREMLSEMLTELDFQPIVASDGYKGIEVYRDSYQDIVLVIIDMIMPGIGGLETYRELKKINPDIVALLATGYSSETARKEIQEEGISGYLAKPFSIDALQLKLDEILSGNPEH